MPIDRGRIAVVAGIAALFIFGAWTVVTQTSVKTPGPDRVAAAAHSSAADAVAAHLLLDAACSLRTQLPHERQRQRAQVAAAPAARRGATQWRAGSRTVEPLKEWI